MRRFTSALVALLLLSPVAYIAVRPALAEETAAVIDNDITEDPIPTEPVVVPPEPTETTTSRVPEPTQTTTTKKPEPTQTTTTKKPEPTQTTTKKPEPTQTTTKKPEPTQTTTTKKPEPTQTTTKKPEEPATTTTTPEPVTEEPPVVVPQETNDPDEPAYSNDRPKETEKISDVTSKKPSKTDKSNVTSEEETSDITSVTTDVTEKEEEDVFTDKKMFATPLEAVSFVLGIFVIISVFVTLFTIARRIVRKYTSDK